MAFNFINHPKAPAVASPEANYSSLVGRLGANAQEYQSGLAGTQGNLQNIAKDSSRLDLAKSYVNADQSANRRGMFYGGVRGGLRAGAESQAAGNLASQYRDINIGTKNTSDELGNAALQSALKLRESQQQQNIQKYNEDLSNMRPSTGYAIGQGIGGIYGAVLGSRQKPSGGTGIGGSTPTASSAFGNDYSLSMPTGVGTTR